MNKFTLICSLIFYLLILTGCWDNVEIEERAFVYGLAIDRTEESKSNSEIELTEQLIVPEQFASTGSGGGGSGPAFRNLTASGETIFDVNREMFKQASRTTDPTHLLLVLFSEELAKEPKRLEQLLDVFLREKDMRRGINIAITSGKASELLTVVPEHEKVPAQYISKLLEQKKNLEIINVVKIGDIQNKLLDNVSFPLPLLKTMNPTVIDYEGIAIYNAQKDQIVGTLKGDYAKGLSFMSGKKHTGTINIEVDQEKATVELTEIKSSFSLINDDPNNLHISVNVEVEGTIAEQLGTDDVLDREVLQQFNRALEKEIEKLTKGTLTILQNDLQTDAIGLGSYLFQHHPKLWKSVKVDWETGEKYFTQSRIDVIANATVNRPGSIIRTTNN
ncbi:spore germination protein [Lysinibacillus composti]|uniref:Ger(x)C family spore germination protein n=1 Tax=Lysinibacillus composti TaxID=720633 RepID=UPI0013158730|nr:Ger(x)C family spore germination protein [Lysinibacillus composti]MBM7608437.1 spore germination protein [Lysinibacillus composti]